MDHHERQKYTISLFWYGRSEYYGIKAFYLPGSLIIHPSSNDGNFEPPDYLAVSANLLYGSGIFLTERQKNS